MIKKSILGTPIPPEESLSNLLNNKKNIMPDQKENQKEQFAARKPYHTFENVILPLQTRQNIDILISRINNHDLLYKDWELSKIDASGRNKVVNFYGPPGTGKTLCAEALASKLDKKIIEINYAEIESKYVGETGKNIRMAFQKASEQNSALFFDEADSILGHRMTEVRQAADQAVNVSRAVMLKELDRFDGIVIFATNLAKNFDSAFVRRILLHIEVPPPDEIGRLKLWQHMISEKVPGRDNIDWEKIAKISDGLVGGDIKNAVIICLSKVADRKEKLLLEIDDIIMAIDAVKHSKIDIGHNQEQLNKNIFPISYDKVTNPQTNSIENIVSIPPGNHQR